MSTISSDERTIEHSPGEKSALLRLSYHVISDQVSGFGSHEARMILHLLARYSRSLRESHPIEDGEGWIEVVCPKCSRHVMSTPLPACGFIANCGRRLTRLSECRPGGCAAPSNPGTAKVENSRST